MIYVMLAEGFGEIAGVTPVDLMRRYGIDIYTVGVTGKMVKGARGITMEADLLPEETSPEKADMIFLPGAIPGVDNLHNSEYVNHMIKAVWERGGYVAAICAAPAVVLGPTGILKDKKATCMFGYEDLLKEAGAIFQDDSYVVDGKLITGRNASSVFQLTAAMCHELGYEEAAKAMDNLCR